MRIGTPSILSLKSLEASLEILDKVDMKLLRSMSLKLSNLMIDEIEKKCPQLILSSPKKSSERGSHLAFKFQNGFQFMQALISKRVIGDFRSPNIIRFGITPLYLDEQEIIKSVKIMSEILNKKIWSNPRFSKRVVVTWNYDEKKNWI